jgi:L-gulonolactone oxidase
LTTFGDRPSPGLISFPFKGASLALDFPNRGERTLWLLSRLDDIVRHAGGRLYPAKDGRMPVDLFRSGYPRWEEFARHVDPGFRSAFWRRVAP